MGVKSVEKAVGEVSGKAEQISLRLPQYLPYTAESRRRESFVRVMTAVSSLLPR